MSDRVGEMEEEFGGGGRGSEGAGGKKTEKRISMEFRPSSNSSR